MADLYDGLEELQPTAPAPALPRPKTPSMYDGLEEAMPRTASGVLEHIQAGLQGSVAGHAWRQRVPDLVMNPETSRWWERAATGISQVAADLPIMIPAGIKGGALSAAAGGAVAGPPGAAVAGIVGGGAAMFAAPAFLRESLVQSFRSGEINTAADWFNAIREIATHTAKEGAIGAVTMGTGALARGGAAAVLGGGAEVAKAVGLGTATMATRTAARATGVVDVATQIAAMTTMPAAMQGRFPDLQEFMDAAIVIGGLKAGHKVADRMLDTYRKTGKTPAEQVADAQADPRVAEDLARAHETTGTSSGVPVKLDRIIAEAEFLARGGVPMAPDIKAIIKEIKDTGPLQGDMVRDIDRIGALADQARQKPLEDAERAELEILRARFADAGREAAAGEPTPAPRFTPDQATDARVRADTRLEELRAKTETGPLTDAERAERVMLTNAKPEALAKHFGIEPAGRRAITLEEHQASAQRVHDEVLRQVRDADRAREDAGLQPLGEDHAAAVAALVRARVHTRAARLGRLPEEIYNEHPLQIRDAADRAPTPEEVQTQKRGAFQFATSIEERGRPAGEQVISWQEKTNEFGRVMYLKKKTNGGGWSLEKTPAREGSGWEPVATFYPEGPVRPSEAADRAVAAAEPAPPAGAPTFRPPEVDLFGEPIAPQVTPRYAVENMATVELPLAGLVLSKDVPQFKAAADATGVVVPLGGQFDRTGVGPIQVWERLNGTMEVISGRHRLDLARRSGETTIPAQVHREADGFDAKQAAVLDAQLNIREEQGSVADYVQYFKDSGITRETADERGLLARAKGRTAYAIARDATADTAAAHRAGLLSDEAALSISQTAPGSERLQALGIAMVNEGKSILIAVNTMRAVDLMASERMAKGAQGDIFGFDDSAMREASAMAKRASSIQRKIGEQISAVSGASRRPELAKKMGVDVQDPEGIQKRIVELRQEQFLWDNWPLHPELVAKLREQVAQGAGGVTGREGELRQGPARAESARDWQDAPTEEADYVTWDAINRLEHESYVKAGTVLANSRQVPNELTFPPVGTWRIATTKGIHGREIEQLVEIPIDRLRLGELDTEGRLDPTKRGDDARYAEWLKEGKRPPPINVLQTESGTLSVTDGHRRALAAKLAGRPTVEAWVNYAVPIPDGGRYNSDPTKPYIRTGMTYEMLTGEIRNPFLDRLKLYQDPVDLKPETPAEATARDAEATAQAQRRLEQRAAADRAEQEVRGPVVHAVRDDGAPLLRHGTTEFVEPEIWERQPDGGIGYQHVVEIAGKDVGIVSLTWKDGQITQLHNIRTYGARNQGSGTAVLRAILTHNTPETTVWLRHVMPEARAWWEKRGAKFFETEEGQDGTLTRADFEARNPLERGDRPTARAAGEGEAAQEGIAPGREGPGVVERARESAVADTFFQDLPLFQQHRGSFQVAENLITIMQGADKSTVVHELGHSWLEEMKFDAARPNAPAQIKADWEMLRRELAIGADGTITRQSHEQFGRSVERYLADGEAPSIALRSVFERFRAWLLEIYQSMANLNVTVNPELRAVLDRMLATDQEIADARALNVPRAYVAEAKTQEGRKIVPGFKAEQVAIEPYADELPKGPGAAPDDSHVNYAYINTPLDVKLTMQRMAEIDQANIQQQRGGTDGVKSWAESNAEQAKYVNDILGGSEDTLRLLSPRDPDAAGPDVRLGILKKLAVGAAKDSARLRDVVLERGHDASVREQLEYLGSIERARMIQAEFLGERASVARALNALKDVTEGSGEIARMLDAIGYGEAAASELYQSARTPAQEQAVLKAKLDEILLKYKGKTVLDIARLHKEIGTLKGTFKFAKEIDRATKWEMVVEAWKAGLLSGPVTHTTNLFGTGAFQAVRAPVDALAAVIGMARGASPGMGESDRASMSEAVARLTGMLGGVQDGLKVGWATFKLDDPTGKTEAYRTAIPGRAGELIRIPLRLMGAEDAIVTTMYRRGEMRTLAIRQAFDENLNPGTREFAERVDHLMDQPTPEMAAEADAAATRMTFNAPLGEKGVALQLFVQKWNLQWMIPFIRTPINITKEVARMSPFAPLVGEWRADIAKGGVARDRALAEAALGTGLMALTMAYAFSGDISGGGSPDPGKNRGKAGVEQPYSWKIRGTWYEYARIQPMGTLIGMAADMAVVWDHMTDEERDKVPKLLARAFSNAVTNQTFLQGITNVINAMSEPARFAPRFLQQMAGSMVPNIVGQPTTMADPVVREVNGMLEAIQARIPGMRQDLLPKRDWLGEQVPTKERLGVVGPVREQKITEDKVRLEAARLDISMAAAPKKTHIGKGTGKLGDVELTPEERNKFQQVGGEMAHRILGNVVNAPGYDQIPDLVKRQIFSKILTASHRVAAVQVLPMDKRVSYLQSITEKMTAELAPATE